MNGSPVSRLVSCGPQAVDARHQVVAFDVGNVDGDAQPLGDLPNPVGATGRIEAASVADDLDAPLDARAEHLFHLGEEGRRVSELAVASPLLVQDQHGQLGQPVAGQHVDVAAVDHLPGRRQPITEEPAAVGDPNRAIRRHDASILTSACPESTCWPATTNTSTTVPVVGDTT